jgi:hypothetical protein
MLPLSALLFKDGEIRPSVEAIIDAHFGSQRHIEMTITDLLISYERTHRELMDLVEIMEPDYNPDGVSLIIHALLGEFFSLDTQTHQSLRKLLHNDGASA